MQSLHQSQNRLVPCERQLKLMGVFSYLSDQGTIPERKVRL